MTARARLIVLLAAAVVIAVYYTVACGALPDFGSADHPYGDRAVRAALAHRTANVVSSVNFDLRAFDTLGEESILFCTVLGSTLLLRRARDEGRRTAKAERVLPTTRLYGALLLPVTLLVGVYIVAHGQLSPGGGFQGGVMLATALHLGYLAADYRVLQRIRPLTVLDVTDSMAAASYALVGLGALLASGAFLRNVLPLGTFNQITSGGTVPVLNAVVGIEVASGVIVLLAHFLDQAVVVTDPDEQETH
ncbi:MnhB domain-containing protein [Streptomyces sp. NPDC086787]|uniref:MnhB domain-containing protein n=1 Tax=Streptomyces sp. NPDC086787 TaxID=3365759 RepID=UPI0037F857F3